MESLQRWETFMDPHVSLWYRWKLVLLFDDNDADADDGHI